MVNEITGDVLCSSLSFLYPFTSVINWILLWINMAKIGFVRQILMTVSHVEF
jgi:hypothetical protein